MISIELNTIYDLSESTRVDFHRGNDNAVHLLQRRQDSSRLHSSLNEPSCAPLVSTKGKYKRQNLLAKSICRNMFSRRNRTREAGCSTTTTTWRQWQEQRQTETICENRQRTICVTERHTAREKRATRTLVYKRSKESAQFFSASTIFSLHGSTAVRQSKTLRDRENREVTKKFVCSKLLKATNNTLSFPKRNEILPHKKKNQEVYLHTRRSKSLRTRSLISDRQNQTSEHCTSEITNAQTQCSQQEHASTRLFRASEK
jgi:hypothetical protein